MGGREKLKSGGRKGEEGREFILNSTPSKIKGVERFLEVQSGGVGRGAAPPHLLIVRGEETRGLLLNSTPPPFFFHSSKIRGVETRLLLFLEVERGGVGGGAAPPISIWGAAPPICLLWSGRKGRRENGPYSKFHPRRIWFCFVFLILRNSEE